MKIAIVGTHPATRENAPWGDSDYLIWLFNETPASPWVKRWDASFQLHAPEVYTSTNNFVDPSHWAWLQQPHPGRVIYMQQRDERVPASVAYPLEGVLADVGHRRYLTSSPAYAIALALHMGYSEIGVWGVELSSNTEYSYQLPCWNYWVGVADGRGAKLELRSGEMHFSAPLYGYEGAVSLPRSLYDGQIVEYVQALDEAKRRFERTSLRLRNSVHDRELDVIPDLVRQLQADGVTLGIADARLAEAQAYGERTDIIPRQEFERRSAQARQQGELRKADMYTAVGFAQCRFEQFEASNDIRVRDALLAGLQRVGENAYRLGLADGSKAANLEYMERLGDLLTAAGGNRTLQKLGMEVA